jgi:hypothetical protein
LSVARVLADAQGAEAEGWPGAEEIEDWSDDGLCPEHIARYLRHGVRDPLEAHRRRRDEVRSKLGPVPEFVLRRKEDPVKPWGLSLNLDADWIGEGECCGGCFINPGLFGESYEAIPPDYGQVTRWATMILRDREGRQIRLRVPVVEVDDDHDEGKAWQATTNGYGIREDRVGEPEWLPEHCPVCGGDDLTADTLVRHASQITRDDPEAPLAYGLESVEVFSDETVMLDVSCDECGEVLWTRSKPITAP